MLARADVGIAMGGLGSDAAIEAADVVIVNDRPSQVVEAIRLARRTKGIIVQTSSWPWGSGGLPDDGPLRTSDDVGSGDRRHRRHLACCAQLGPGFAWAGWARIEAGSLPLPIPAKAPLPRPPPPPPPFVLHEA